jgi:hypothetical protein
MRLNQLDKTYSQLDHAQMVQGVGLAWPGRSPASPYSAAAWVRLAAAAGSFPLCQARLPSCLRARASPGPVCGLASCGQCGPVQRGGLGCWHVTTADPDRHVHQVRGRHRRDLRQAPERLVVPRHTVAVRNGPDPLICGARAGQDRAAAGLQGGDWFLPCFLVAAGLWARRREVKVEPPADERP